MAVKKAATRAHPTYPSPTISEALCEVHFRLAPGRAWEPSLLGDFFKAVQNDFPRMEPMQQVGVSIELGPQGLAQRLLPGQPRAKFSRPDQPLVMQLSESVFTVNRLAPYPGWKIMRADVLNLWNQAKAVLEPAAVARIGLRYINRIPRKKPDEAAGRWLSDNDYVAKAALHSTPGFLSRSQVRHSDQDRSFVTLADEPESGGSGPGTIIFDIDCIREQLAAAPEAIGAAVDALHERVWEIFDAAASSQLKKRMQSEAKP